ncbi:hypothetical protein VPHD69_0171 [Vibrio phage D69]
MLSSCLPYIRQQGFHLVHTKCKKYVVGEERLELSPRKIAS